MEADTSIGRQIEWQLDAQDLRVVVRWIETFVESTDSVTLTSGRTINHIDTYVDTEDRRLDRAGYTVRLRRRRRMPPVVTLEPVDGSASAALRNGRGLAELLDDEDAGAVVGSQGPVGQRVRALVGPRKLVPLFDLHARRRIFPLAVAGEPSGELLLVETAIRGPDGGVLGRLRRVEVEVPDFAVEAVGELVQNLRTACGLQPALLSEYEAALAARGFLRVAPDTFGSTEITPDATVGEVALAVVRRQFAALLAKEPGARLGDDIEELHELRVATRRLRAAIALFAGYLPAEVTRLRPDIAWLGQVIGAVRDLDVQLEQLEEWIRLAPEFDWAPLNRLRTLLQEDRAAARGEMLEALDSRRFDGFVRRFARVLRTRTGARTPPVLAVAPELVQRRLRGMEKARRRAVKSGEPSAYHRLRIAGKRLRYALEFLAEVYPDRTKTLVKRIVALQDLLGAFQDAEVASARLRELAARRGDELGPQAVFAMGEIAERYRASMDDFLARVPKAYGKVTRSEWKALRKSMEAERAHLPAAGRLSAD